MSSAAGQLRDALHDYSSNRSTSRSPATLSPELSDRLRDYRGPGVPAGDYSVSPALDRVRHRVEASRLDQPIAQLVDVNNFDQPLPPTPYEPEEAAAWELLHAREKAAEADAARAKAVEEETARVKAEWIKAAEEQAAVKAAAEEAAADEAARAKAAAWMKAAEEETARVKAAEEEAAADEAARAKAAAYMKVAEDEEAARVNAPKEESAADEAAKAKAAAWMAAAEAETARVKAMEEQAARVKASQSSPPSSPVLQSSPRGRGAEPDPIDPVDLASGGSEDYEPKCVLVTGGAGFIASHVVIRLVTDYPELMVVNYDKLDRVASLKNLTSIERLRNYKFVKGDINSADLLNYVIQQEQVDTIMHFAAESHVDNSFGNSFIFTQTNVMGTHTVMEVAKINKKQIRRVIHVSTDEVYGEQGFADPACRESFVLEPTNPYAASKAGAELIAKSYMRSFGVPLIISRGNNVYGPHQFPEKMIPKFINQIIRGWPVTLHGGGWTHRNMLYVEDVARAFDVILHKGQLGQVYNIGGEETNEISVRGVAERLLEIMRPGCRPEEHLVSTPDRVFNDTRYHIDSSSLHKLGWKMRVGFAEGLRRTVEWYQSPCGDNWGDITSVLSAHAGGLVITSKPQDQEDGTATETQPPKLEQQ